MRKLLFPCILLLISYTSFCQQFGGNPPSLKWKQINTDSVRVIFPAGMDSQANRVASIAHYLASEKPFSLGNQLKKINIVLQNQTTVANGYVQLGPFRSEFFMTPVPGNFDQGSISWSDQLALHEYRHVQQFNNFNNGISSIMKVLFGEEGYSLAINASIPDWFYEGDAVYNETVLTQQGRGRLPLFLNAYPSLWQAGKKYSWMKLRNGSFKDFVPNHYYLGYLLVNYGREKYGADFWTKVTKDASAYKGLFYPFQTAIKKYAGVDYKTFRDEAFEFYKKNVARTSMTREDYVSPVKKEYVASYYFPYQAGIDSLLYLKSTYRHRPAFYIKDKNGEHRLRARDISIDEQFSYRNGKIVYASFESDHRWTWRTYSVIKMLDVQTGRQQTLRKKTKYFTPDISADGSRVAAIQISATGKSELHVLDVKSGEVLKTIASAEISLFTDPKFINENSLVTAVRLNNGQMALAIADIETASVTRLTPPSFNIVGYPCVENNVIYFTASYNGNDDVFALKLSDKKIYRITNGPLGNYYVNVSNGKITWSSFTAEGYQLKQVNEKDITWNEISMAGVTAMREIFPVSHGIETKDVLLGKIPGRNFPVKHYSKGTGLLNFHSWRPYYEDPIFTYSLYGQNVLHTMLTELYYLYNQNEKTNAIGFSAVYGAWFPYVDIGSEFTFNRESFSGNRIQRWNQLDSRAGLIIPLNYVNGRTFKNFSFSNYYVLRNEFNKDFFKDSLGNTSFSYLSHTISWSQQVQRAVQHIFPRFGYAVSLAHRYPITRYEGYQVFANGTLYLPGILSNHNLVITGSFQQRDTSRLIFSSRLATARGYSDYYGTRAGSRTWRLSGNYHLPVLTPDWGFGNILYIHRLRANVFYDFQRYFSDDKTQTYDLRSTGLEFYADTKWWNQHPLTFGFRISRLLDDDPRGGNPKGTNLFEFILPVSIIPR